MSFYQKYRPQKLADVVGQQPIVQTFLNALQSDSLAHAFLFAGPRGTGKTSIARIIARAINCLNPQNGEPCNECELCLDSLDNKLVDLLEIDAASNRGIDEIRELREKISFAPSRGKAKIYIIDEVHMLTREAFNALLKTLEEPPAHAYFILATTEVHKIPETIISRCQRFDFRRISDDEVLARLKLVCEQEKIKADDDSLRMIAKNAAGGMRDALSLLEQIGSGGEITPDRVAENLGLTHPQTVSEFVAAVDARDASAALAKIDELVAGGGNLIQFNRAVLESLREKMLAAVAAGDLAAAQKILVTIDEFARAGEELKSAIIPQLPLETAAVAVAAGGQRQNFVEKESGALKKVPTENFEKKDAFKKEQNGDLVSFLNKKSEEYEKKENPKTIPYQFNEVASKAENNILNNSRNEIDFQTLQQKFATAVTKIKSAAVKLSLKDCRLESIENSMLVVSAPSDFTREKIDKPEIKNELSNLLAAEVGKIFEIKFTRAEVPLASVTPEPAAETPPEKKPESLADAADNLF